MRIPRNSLAKAGLAVAVWCALIVLVFDVKYLIHRVNCKKQLRSVSAAVALYRGDHANQIPTTLVAMEVIPPGFFDVCPGAPSHQVSTPDYVFINWSKTYPDLASVPNNYPLMYDADTTNHSGAGVNVLLVSGTVFWDANANWLDAFCSAHPQYGLLRPRHAAHQGAP